MTIPVAGDVDDFDPTEDGVMVAFFLPGPLATKLALPGGEPASELHLTLAYLGHDVDLPNPDGLKAAVASWAAMQKPIEGEVAGIGQFTAGPEPVTYVSIDAPDLPSARQSLVEAIAAWPVNAEHGFTPHVTLDYADRLDEPDVGGEPVTFQAVTVCIGPEKTSYTLGTANFTKAAGVSTASLFPAFDDTKAPLTPAQTELASAYDAIVKDLGLWEQDDTEVEYSGPDGMTSIDGVLADPNSGRCCYQCAGWSGEGVVEGRGLVGSCKWVNGPIDPNGFCKLGLVPPAPPADEVEDFEPDDDEDPSWEQPLDRSGPTSTQVHIPSTIWGDDEPKILLPYGDSKIPLRKAAGEVDPVLMYTFAPWYIPNRADFHGDFTDEAELRLGQKRYVETGDRSIRLQHNTLVTAGEWVDFAMWPYPVEAPLFNPATGKTTTIKLPANTVFMGVYWQPWAWQLVLDGKILGFSMGGGTGCMLVEVDPSEVEGLPSS